MPGWRNWLTRTTQNRMTEKSCGFDSHPRHIFFSYMKIIKTSLFVLRDKEDRILLQHRDRYAPTSPNYWGFFGGRIEKGETPEQAGRREAKEELGIELKGLKFFKKYKFQNKDMLREKFVFTAPLTIPLEKLKKHLQTLPRNSLRETAPSSSDAPYCKSEC